ASPTERTGSTPRTEPVKNSSPVAIMRSRPSRSWRTSIPKDAAVSIARARATPGSRRPSAGGVSSTPSSTAKTLAREASSTAPSTSSTSGRCPALSSKTGPSLSAHLWGPSPPATTSGRSATARSHGGNSSSGSTGAATTPTSSDPFAPGATLRRRRPTASAAARPATSSRNPAGSSAWNSSRTLSRSRARCGPSSIADPSRIRIVSNTPIAGSGRISADTAALWRGRLADFKPGRRQASEPGSASAPVFGRGAGARAGLRSCDVPAVKTLLIDNYDSFTYNLFQLLAEVNGDEPHVVRNDAAPWAELERLPFDNVVISPGPGRPERQGDFGICGEAIAQARVPLLGVCLGHQGLSSIHGGSVSPAAEAMHGRVSTVRHDGSPLFEGIPPDFQAVRYHSLVVAEPLPEPLEAIA